MVLDNSVHFQTSGLTSLVWILQCGLDAFGLQRAGDWQEDGGEEDSEPGRQEERAGRETGHGLRLQEVTWQHVRDHCVLYLCDVWFISKLLRVFPVAALCLTQWCQRCRWSSRKLPSEQSPPLDPNWTCLMSQVSPLDPQSTHDTCFLLYLLLFKCVDPISLYSLLTSSLISCTGCFRYKDNPFTVGDSFGSRWDTEGGTASFTTSWALEKEDPKEEVTISSIQPIGERYLHSLCLLFFKTHRQ